ncbi:hypothetical protein HanPI659440_Chr02g0046551 [Helianthus annuus]|nr:hypothetical protein HanIR_Chr12g0602131 [Helianthus annuus]KAJ0805161.1 hypothetical protein HanPI659440_Chr02g0046551 [Helianthus annuus]
MSHKRGFRNDINNTSFITRMIYDLVCEKQMFWVKIHGSRFINYSQTILIRLFILRYKHFIKQGFLMTINEVAQFIPTYKRAMNLTLS